MNKQIEKEQKLVESVRNTIYKAYERTENFEKNLKKSNDTLNDYIIKCKKEVEDCKDDFHENNRKLNLKIEKLKKEIERLNRFILVFIIKEKIQINY